MQKLLTTFFKSSKLWSPLFFVLQLLIATKVMQSFSKYKLFCSLLS